MGEVIFEIISNSFFTTINIVTTLFIDEINDNVVDDGRIYNYLEDLSVYVSLVKFKFTLFVRFGLLHF